MDFFIFFKSEILSTWLCFTFKALHSPLIMYCWLIKVITSKRLIIIGRHQSCSKPLIVRGRNCIAFLGFLLSCLDPIQGPMWHVWHGIAWGGSARRSSQGHRRSESWADGTIWFNGGPTQVELFFYYHISRPRLFHPSSTTSGSGYKGSASNVTISQGPLPWPIPYAGGEDIEVLGKSVPWWSLPQVGLFLGFWVRVLGLLIVWFPLNLRA